MKRWKLMPKTGRLFSKDQIIKAMEEAGKPIKDFDSISIGEKGPSGRALPYR